jgi:MYXO-CTERM domain-containing protein
MTQCQSTGAIVCNGEYVSASDVQQCVTSLNAVLTTQINATVTATGSSSCDGGECSGQGTVNGKVSCAAAPGSAGGPCWAFGAALVGVIASVRRRARR